MQSKTSRLSQAHGVSMDEKTTVVAEAKRKEEVLSAEVHRLETEVSQMKSELHNATKEIFQMAQSLHNEKERSLREIQAKIADVEAEKVRAQQSMQEAKRLMQKATEGKDQVVLDMQAKLDNVEAEESRPCRLSKTKDNCAKMQSRNLDFQAGAGVSMDEKTAVMVRRKSTDDVDVCRGTAERQK